MNKLYEFPEILNKMPRDKRPTKAVELLMKYLEERRGTKYQQDSQPDKDQRQEPAADFVYVERDSEKRIAVEFTEFADPKVEEASSLIKFGKRIRKRSPSDVTPMELDGEQSGFVEPPRSYPDDFAFLNKFVAEKIAKGQLQNTEADERILLVYDATLMPESSFQRYQYRCGLAQAERDQVDHAFVILEQRQLNQLW